MLELKGIKKDYLAGENTVHALKGIDLRFRRNEFVSILGPSGCGKTTMLNIIGGLDQYTEGDLIINGRSTKDFKDRDWDTYRNHSIGFVFQSYNLIPHQTVLQNVELALTLSGVSKAERRKHAKKALEDVGLGNQLSKKPSEMSGGQMQRCGNRTGTGQQSGHHSGGRAYRCSGYRNQHSGHGDPQGDLQGSPDRHGHTQSGTGRAVFLPHHSCPGRQSD